MNQGQSLAPAERKRVHDLLAAQDTPFARACLTVMDDGADVADAAAAAGVDAMGLMGLWHEFAEANGVVASDGSRACIAVLVTAYDQVKHAQEAQN